MNGPTLGATVAAVIMGLPSSASWLVRTRSASSFAIVTVLFAMHMIGIVTHRRERKAAAEADEALHRVRA